MDLRILEIAAHTENNKVVENYTHKSKHKNPLCGDEMEISLIVKEDVVKDMGYQCKSCLLYTSPSPRDTEVSRMPSSA